MEYGTLRREVYIDAAPQIVFEVVSHPDHLKRWWPDDARYEPTPGSAGDIVFGNRETDGKVVPFTVVDVRPPRTFSFRWAYPAEEAATERNSLLVTFDVAPSGDGTLLTMTETGFREQGWDVAVLEQEYERHVTGWDFYLPRLAPYISTLVPRP